MPTNDPRPVIEPFLFPTVLTRDNLDSVLGDYLHCLGKLRLDVEGARGVDLLLAMGKSLDCGPYPTMMCWADAVWRIERDLVLLYGTLALFHRLPFSNYALDFGDSPTSGVRIMSRLGDDIAVGVAVPRASGSWRPAERRRLARRLRADPDPEIRYRILLLERGMIRPSDRPRPRIGEIWGLVNILTGEVAFVEP